MSERAVGSQGLSHPPVKRLNPLLDQSVGHSNPVRSGRSDNATSAFSSAKTGSERRRSTNSSSAPARLLFPQELLEGALLALEAGLCKTGDPGVAQPERDLGTDPVAHRSARQQGVEVGEVVAQPGLKLAEKRPAGIQISLQCEEDPALEICFGRAGRKRQHAKGQSEP